MSKTIKSVCVLGNASGGGPEVALLPELFVQCLFNAYNQGWSPEKACDYNRDSGLMFAKYLETCQVTPSDAMSLHAALLKHKKARAEASNVDQRGLPASAEITTTEAVLRVSKAEGFQIRVL